jgi:hypothetical protein
MIDQKKKELERAQGKIVHISIIRLSGMEHEKIGIERPLQALGCQEQLAQCVG